MEIRMKNDDVADRFENELKKFNNLRIEFPNLNLVNQRWEILNFIASYLYRGSDVCVSDVYHGLNYPRESVIRAIDTLVQSGILSKSADNVDKRRKYLKLTDKTKKLLDTMSNVTEPKTA